MTLLTGETMAITAIAKDAAGAELRSQRLVWSARNVKIASVSASGIVTAVATGSTQVSVSAAGVSTLIPVAVTRRPTSVVSVTPASSTIRVGNSVALTATAFDNAGDVVKERPITWKTSDVSKATVSASGSVSGIGDGIVTITATVDGVSDAAVVAVQSIPVDKVHVAPSKATILLRESMQLTVSVLDANGNPLTGRTITWSSSNTGTVSVSSSGVATGTGLGSATITASSEGKSATARIMVSLLGS
ncbi:MAG: Ig-like domain-containing protein [Gemmatimonadaceae bacterium]